MIKNNNAKTYTNWKCKGMWLRKALAKCENFTYYSIVYVILTVFLSMWSNIIPISLLFYKYYIFINCINCPYLFYCNVHFIQLIMVPTRTTDHNDHQSLLTVIYLQEFLITFSHNYGSISTITALIILSESSSIVCWPSA